MFPPYSWMQRSLKLLAKEPDVDFGKKLMIANINDKGFPTTNTKRYKKNLAIFWTKDTIMVSFSLKSDIRGAFISCESGGN